MMPFPGGLEGTTNGIFLLSIVAALLYLPVLGQAPSLRRTAVKAGSTALLAALAFKAGGPLLLVVALALSALGDALLAQEKRPVADKAHSGPSPQGDRGFAAAPLGAGPYDAADFFVAGLASFLLAHIAYIALFLRAGGGVAVFTAGPWSAAAALAVIVFAGGMLMLLWTKVEARLRLPVAAYAVAIGAMVLSALTVPSLQLAVGAVLFMASDALLAWEKFLTDAEHRRPAAAITGWVLYYAAQLLITFAVLL